MTHKITPTSESSQLWFTCSHLFFNTRKNFSYAEVKRINSLVRLAVSLKAQLFPNACECWSGRDVHGDVLSSAVASIRSLPLILRSQKTFVVPLIRTQEHTFIREVWGFLSKKWVTSRSSVRMKRSLVCLVRALFSVSCSLLESPRLNSAFLCFPPCGDHGSATTLPRGAAL